MAYHRSSHENSLAYDSIHALEGGASHHEISIEPLESNVSKTNSKNIKIRGEESESSRMAAGIKTFEVEMPNFTNQTARQQHT